MTTNRYISSPVAPRRKRRSLIRRVLSARTIGVALLVLGGIWVIQQWTGNTHKSSDTKTSSLKTKSTKLSKGTPTYTTYLPAGKTAKDYGGWTRVSPPKSDPVYAYRDVIGKVPIIVSQQKLPRSFAGDVEDQVAELAQEYSASQKITAKDITVYVGRSSDGPESVIFAKEQTLILIKTDDSVSNDALLAYIESLEK